MSLTELRPDQLTDAELARANREFETAPAGRVIEWAVESFGSSLTIAASMADAVLIDLAVAVDPGIEVVFLDTQYHFPETLETAERIRARYDLNLRVLSPDAPKDDLWKVDTDACCALRKVAQLDEALAGKEAWMSGLRRAEATTRNTAPIVARDLRGLVKVNPLATWSDLDVAGYIADHDIIVNPLVAQGYASIGCWPCTRRVEPGEDTRAGRWSGTAKVECGLHL